MHPFAEASGRVYGVDDTFDSRRVRVLSLIENTVLVDSTFGVPRAAAMPC